MTDVPVERRLAAILAADIAGYTRLMRADEAGTLDRVKKLRAEVLEPETAAQGGRIVKSMGDGFLIEFASAVAAARCALAVQAALDNREAGLPPEQRIAMRICIHVGEIILDSGDIFGDGVNVAARLEAIGEPGGIVLSGGAHELVADRVEAEFEDLGARALRNIDTPVTIFRVWRDGAAAAPEAAARAEPGFGLADLVMIYGQTGEADKAAETARALLKARPEFTVAGWRTTQHRDDREQMERDAEALLAAGVPE